VKVQRLLGNLVRNAIEAMGDRGGQLTIRVERDDDDLVIVVADTGRGIPKEIQHRLFKSFVTSGKAGGTGLGLSIVKKIAQEHSGTVSVDSSSDGTTFVVRLPQSEHEGVISRRMGSGEPQSEPPEPPAPAPAERPRRTRPGRPATVRAAPVVPGSGRKGAIRRPATTDE
jgi:anti-sigma regulatory factor (Ser/Thr protein kinase)